MTTRIVPPLPVTERARRAIERFEIHAAVCRARRQHLCCSTCSDLADSVTRTFRALLASEVA
jgi:hypothetical protein